MSLKALVWAFDSKVGSSSLKLILLKLADNFNDETQVCFPSIGHLSKYTELNEKTIRSGLKKLAELGMIKVEKRKVSSKHNLSNVYRLIGVQESGSEGTPKIGSTKIGSRVLPKLGGGVLPKLGGESPISESVIKPTGKGGSKQSDPLDPALQAFLVWFKAEYQRVLSKPVFIAWGRDKKILRPILVEFSIEEIRLRAERMLRTQEPWLMKTGQDVPMLVNQWNKLASQAVTAQEVPSVPVWHHPDAK